MYRAAAVPLSDAVPLTLASEAVVGLSVTRYIAPDWNARLPATVIDEPGVPLPGANVPPPAIVLLPTMPVPVSTPSALTMVITDGAIEPSTCNTPLLTVVVPV